MTEKSLTDTRFDHIYQLLQLQQQEILSLKKLTDLLNTKLAIYIVKQENKKKHDTR